MEGIVIKRRYFMKNHIVFNNSTLLEALKQINGLAPEPLVLFVLDSYNIF